MITLRGLLSFAVLVGGAMPPSHAHRDGDFPHRHGQKSGVLLHTDAHFSHSHRHDPDHHDQQTGLLDSGPRGHVHLTIFGIDLAFSHSCEGNSPCEAANDDQVAAVRLVDGKGQISKGQRLLPLFELGDVRCGCDWHKCAVPSPSPAPPPVTTHPLCETARHERSGVLRA